MILPLLFALNSIPAPTPDVDLYIGTYTTDHRSKGIYHVVLNTDTGTLTQPVVAAEITNPSYLALDSTGRFLYAVNESSQGEVWAYAVGADKKLTYLNHQSTKGSDPCHLSVAPGNKAVLVANYSKGNVTTFPIETSGKLAAATGEFQNQGSGPNSGRQEGPHMHDIAADPLRRFVYACDLGTDEILVFPFDKRAGTPSMLSPRRVKSPAGSGPRHAVMDAKGKFLYVNNELKNTVSVFGVGARTGPMNEIQNLPTLPGDYAGQNTTAEIVIHPNGKWLYVSNRGHDSIACYEVGPAGRLTLIEIHRLKVHEPRGFAVDPTGNWIVVGGQRSSNLASLKIDQATGALHAEASIIDLPLPVSVLFKHP